MRILDINNNEVVNPDYELGYTVPDKLFIKHHDGTLEIEEVSHMLCTAEYANGGKDYVKVIDVPYSPPKEPWDEFEEIRRYIMYTEEELEKRNAPTDTQILQGQLAALCMITDHPEVLQNA